MTRTSKSAFVLAVVAFLVLLAPGAAFANYAIHGGYTDDTDACAGCHRAHTSASSITWNSPSGGERSALLISDFEDNWEFCMSCHSSWGTGADTWVDIGYYDGNLHNNSGGMLLGGLFDINKNDNPSASAHAYIGSWGAYGGGPSGMDRESVGEFVYGEGLRVPMTCSSCHDVHGSSNYRLLKDVLSDGYGQVVVGGYDGGGNPQPFVISAEPGYPLGGWRLHQGGIDDVAGYIPNYTEPMYARAPGNDQDKGISNWCAGCHHHYGTRSLDVVNGAIGSSAELLHDILPGGDPLDPSNRDHFYSQYQAGETNDPAWFTIRHRHPVNVPLSNFDGPRPLNLGLDLPVAHDPTEANLTVGLDDWLDCMTCHVAHGSNAAMSGEANQSVDAAGNFQGPNTGNGGVPPTDTNALLRLDNRGVCQACHQK